MQPVGGTGSAPGSEPVRSGERPERPVERIEPRLWESKVEVGLLASPGASRAGRINLSGTVFWWPLIAESTYTRLDAGSGWGELWVDGKLVADASARIQTRDSLTFGTSAVGIPVGEVSAQSVRAVLSWRQECWSSRVDERAAAQIAWPNAWPSEVQQALLPQPGIESDAQDFKSFVDRVSAGKLHSVTPWIAAKELVRATVRAFRVVDGSGRWPDGAPMPGFAFWGALDAMGSARGSSHDLSAACVAVLRAAGIPARPVLGLAEVQGTGDTKPRAQFVSWCEFYLPTAGWVPFDPMELRGSMNGGLAIDRPWPNFGTWDDLNRRVPIAFTWTAPIPGTTSLDVPSGWSWPIDSALRGGAYRQTFGVQITNRGRVKE